MRATGIVRRIDDLGRVVIPKEIRRTLRIKEGDPLELFTDNEGGIIFRKYSPICEILSEFAQNFADTFFAQTGAACIVTDNDCVVVSKGLSSRVGLDCHITDDLTNNLQNRRMVIPAGKYIKITERAAFLAKGIQIIMPIISTGDVVGGIIAYTEEQDITKVKTCIEFMARTLGKSLED